MGWDDERTAWYYEQFCERHDRYREANRCLIAHSALGPAQRVLDLAAGTGRTAEAALPFLGSTGCMLCVEPAAEMRKKGMARIRDRRVRWCAEIPEDSDPFDRIVCGAAIWQLSPLSETFARLRRLLSPSGALAFNIPSAYLGEADEPGGGRDPYLCTLPALLSCRLFSPTPEPQRPLSRLEIEELLKRAAFRAEPWTARIRLTQEALRDWLKIPVMTDPTLDYLDPDRRAERIDEAFRRVDPRSWRWENWTGWTAWAV